MYPEPNILSKLFTFLQNDHYLKKRAIINTGGIRSWVDEGDNDSVPPRPQPTNSANRFYKVVVE